jgi:hypothetical protein
MWRARLSSPLLLFCSIPLGEASTGVGTIVSWRASVLGMSWLRPGVQVPLATACTFGAMTAIVLRVLRVGDLWARAGDAGVTIAAVLSLGALRLLARTDDADRARIRAIAWPPAIAGIIGAAVNCILHLKFPRAELAFQDLSLSDLGPAEPLAVGMLSAGAGLLGSLVLVPQVWLLARARASDDAAKVARVARSLAVTAWALAFVTSAAARLVARQPWAPAFLFLIASLGLVVQALLLRRERAVPMPVSGPYR